MHVPGHLIFRVKTQRVFDCHSRFGNAAASQLNDGQVAKQFNIVGIDDYRSRRRIEGDR
ncbi:hypothetical protein [Blastopirellula marina]|uniref:hypothetical protein n=1 Tax=Blastopirellula marina TaxID=124 RepID=UPI00031AA8FE|nr:hypothetical protein [Blastopirellula marina]